MVTGGARRDGHARPRRCLACGTIFVTEHDGGRPPVVCPACQPAHAARLAAHRQQRYRQRRREQADQIAERREQQAAFQAERLRRDHPAVVDILLRHVSPEVADLVIDTLLRQRAEDGQKGG